MIPFPFSLRTLHLVSHFVLLLSREREREREENYGVTCARAYFVSGCIKKKYFLDRK